MLRASALALIPALILVAAAAQAAGPTENATLKRAAAYGSDGKWWKCDPDPDKGCQTGPLDRLGLTRDEQAYVRQTLDKLPWRPHKATMAQVAALMGTVPTVAFARQSFVGVGPGSSPERGVNVYHVGGYVSMIHWHQPGRFLLVKRQAE